MSSGEHSTSMAPDGPAEAHAPVEGAPVGARSAEDAGARAAHGAPPARPVVVGARRTHPLTPLITGWKIIAGIVAVMAAQNLAQLLDDITLMRVLIALGLMAVAVVIGVLISAASWWFTTYEISEDGVTLRHGMISKNRRFAPREKIESVSVERPLLARLIGLAKVRVEIVGGSESHLDITYVTADDAESIRRTILHVAHDGPGSAISAPDTDSPAGGAPGNEAGPEGASASADSATGHRDQLRELLHDGVTDGELIAEIPTQRVIHSMLRDLGLWIGLATMVVVAIGVAVGAIFTDGMSLAVLAGLIPAVIAGPQMLLKRLEAGWGFVSRDTDSGLRMRRGLLNTRTDNVAPGRIQQLTLERPLLWRGPGWTKATVELAGTDGSDENGAEAVLPVGTREELDRTLGHLMAPLGTADDAAMLEHLLTARARDIDGLRASHRFHWIIRRTEATVVLPEAVVYRTGILSHRLVVIPRGRIQTVELSDGPVHRRTDGLDLEVRVAGDQTTLDSLPREAAARLYAELSHDAATRRRYRDRAHWPQPRLRQRIAEETKAVPLNGTAAPATEPVESVAAGEEPR